jgi:CYTH domain-containing protein/predicted ATPase
MNHKLFRIVLSGGPAAGKSTSLVHISDRFRSLGFNVYLVPEVATMMILGGVNLNTPIPEQTLHVQSQLLKTQLHLEKTFTELAQASGKDSIIIFDRGTMDAAAFLDKSIWQAVMDENGYSLVGLRDKHYDAVIHLVTAAIGAPDFYTLENNAARSETPEQAAAVDLKIRDAWLGHPHLKIIDNSTDFAGKINRVLETISKIVGVPEPIETERKFLIEVPELPKDLKISRVNIEQTYLISEDQNQERVRKRGQDSSFVYTHTIKKFISAGKNVEVERIISSREYLTLLNRADSEKNVIKKERFCFLYQNHYFELDKFSVPDCGFLLEIEVDNLETKIEMPSFIKVIKEVTEDKKYSNFELANRA